MLRHTHLLASLRYNRGFQCFQLRQVERSQPVGIGRTNRRIVRHKDELSFRSHAETSEESKRYFAIGIEPGLQRLNVSLKHPLGFPVIDAVGLHVGFAQQPVIVLQCRIEDDFLLHRHEYFFLCIIGSINYLQNKTS